MREALRVVAVLLALVALAACGGRATSAVAEPAQQAGDRSENTTPTTTEAAEAADAARAASARQLFATIDAALARETSVRQEMGNLNPPPAVVLEQEYGDGRDHLALTVDLGPRTEPLRVYRVDGMVHVAGQEPRPMGDVDPDDTALLAVAMHSDVREDFRRMARIADDLDYIGEEQVAGVPTDHYRVTLTLRPGKNPVSLPASLRGPKPADLWVAASGLPVRVEVTYSEPLNGVAGTGVSRTDYSAWSAPLDLDPAELDRARD